MLRKFFSKHLKSDVIKNGHFEHVPIIDNLKSIIKQKNELQENNHIGGYVTITKNIGRKDEQIIQTDVPNLLTLSGRDFFHDQVYQNTSGMSRGSNVIALSLDPTTPDENDTTLAGEITGNGLARIQASTISHGVGTNVTTLINTFSATGAFLDLHKSALFAQVVSGGQMTHTSAFDVDVTLGMGDTITVTWTLTLG